MHIHLLNVQEWDKSVTTMNINVLPKSYQPNGHSVHAEIAKITILNMNKSKLQIV